MVTAEMCPPAPVSGISAATTRTMAGVLGGTRRGKWSALAFVGPAVVASVAYLDPGNFAANIQAGGRYGYQLLWVVLIANLVAMLFQAMSAKIGIVTGRNLAELSAQHFSRPVGVAMWVAAEIAAMATDLAEFLGGAVGFMLLFHIPLMTAMLVMGGITYAILAVGSSGFRPMELVIGGLVAVIALAYVAEMFLAPPDAVAVVSGLTIPHLADSGAVLLAVGVVGSTVMPHAIYLHSGLTQGRAPARHDREKAKLIRFSNREVVVALGVAGLVNMAMVTMAAQAFFGSDAPVQLDTAYRTLIPALGMAAAGLFLIALTASGIASSVVGTMAGQMIMQGFVGFRIPVWVRRVATMAPAFVVVAVGADITQSLVLSQVILSLVLPVPMLALIVLSRRADVMGRFALGRGWAFAATSAAVAVIGLNLVLIGDSIGLLRV